MRNRHTKFIIAILSLYCVTACGGNVDYIELPSIDPSETIIFHTGYTLSYDHKNLIPKWVAYELTADEAVGEFPRSGNFGMDPDLNGKQAMREDYSRSGWDKGHMAPAADMKWSQETMYESFYLTNICPQNHTLNERDWRILEQKVRDLAMEFGSVYVVCGPIIGSNKYGSIGANNVTIPDAFFKALMIPYGTSYETIAFIMLNESDHHSLKEYVITVNELEEITGIDFFPTLSDSEEEVIESRTNLKIWGVN